MLNHRTERVQTDGEQPSDQNNSRISESDNNNQDPNCDQQECELLKGCHRERAQSPAIGSLRLVRLHIGLSRSSGRIFDGSIVPGFFRRWVTEPARLDFEAAHVDLHRETFDLRAQLPRYRVNRLLLVDLDQNRGFILFIDFTGDYCHVRNFHQLGAMPLADRCGSAQILLCALVIRRLRRRDSRDACQQRDRDEDRRNFPNLHD